MSTGAWLLLELVQELLQTPSEAEKQLGVSSVSSDCLSTLSGRASVLQRSRRGRSGLF